MNTQNSYLANMSLSIKFCHNIIHDENWNEKKTKTHYTFWCVHEGSFLLKINGRLFTVSEGDVVFFYPGNRYRAYTDGTKCSFLYACFSLETGNSIDILAGNNYAGVYRQERISDIAENFYEKNLKICENWGAIAFQQYMAFLDFFSSLAPFLGQQEPFFDAAPAPDDSRIRRVLDYIHEYFLDPLTNEELAAYMGMSEKYFIRFFRSNLGKSPKQYIQEYRMKYSLTLLAIPENSLADIALQLNFADQFIFSKAFKRYYGESPSVFRKQLT